MRPATKAEILDFLRVQSPPLVIHEVTEENLAELRVRYTGNLIAGWVLWEVRAPRPPSAPQQMIGVLWSTPAWGQPGKPLYELIARTPGMRPPWALVRNGLPVIDDGDLVSIQSELGSLGSITSVPG